MGVPVFEQNGIPIPQVCFTPTLVEIGQTVRKKSFKGRKSYQTNRQTDGRRTNCDGNSSFEPSALVS